MLKILQARLQHYVNQTLLDVQTGFRKGRGTKQSNWRYPLDHGKRKRFPKKKKICFCFLDYTKKFDCVDHKEQWKILKEMGMPDHLTCLLWNLYAGQEATVRTGQRTVDWFRFEKGVYKGCILSPCLFNLYAGYIMWNDELDDLQAGIKIVGRNINNLRYGDESTLMGKIE